MGVSTGAPAIAMHRINASLGGHRETQPSPLVVLLSLIVRDNENAVAK
jgi:hypothetical protein